MNHSLGRCQRNRATRRKPLICVRVLHMHVPRDGWGHVASRAVVNHSIVRCQCFCATAVPGVTVDMCRVLHVHVPRDLWCHVASRRGPSSLCLRSKADQQASCIFTRAGECCANPCGEGLAVTQQRRNTRVTVVRPLSRHRGSNASWSCRSLFISRKCEKRMARGAYQPLGFGRRASCVG